MEQHDNTRGAEPPRRKPANRHSPVISITWEHQYYDGDENNWYGRVDGLNHGEPVYRVFRGGWFYLPSYDDGDCCTTDQEGMDCCAHHLKERILNALP